jgi:hypothetical protein
MGSGRLVISRTNWSLSRTAIDSRRPAGSGYFNRPRTLKTPFNEWHREVTRASWLRGYRILRSSSSKVGAYDRALDHGAEWMLYYHTIENAPTSQELQEENVGTSQKPWKWDTGLFGLPRSGTVDITGTRNYGKSKKRGDTAFVDDKQNPNNPQDSHRQGRRAYCAIWRWVRKIGQGYSTQRNGCPRSS